MKRLHWHDYITINVYWLGLTMVSQTNGLIIPLLVQKFVGPEQQGTAFGRLRLYTLMVALRRLGLAGTDLAKARCDTIRLKLLKIGAQIRVTVRKVWVSLAEGYPYQRLFEQVYRHLVQLRSIRLRC